MIEEIKSFEERKEELIKKLFSKPDTKSFTVRELDTLLNKCNCSKYHGGRGSSLKYIHIQSGLILTFDGPHPGNELYSYQIKKVRKYLIDIGEVE